MRESIKSTLAFVMIVGIVISAIGWNDAKPDTTSWCARIGGAAVALLAIGVIVKMHFRADLVHDYLRDVVGNYFNRDGFCFAINFEVDGVAYMIAYFQNQRNRPSIGRIAVRPAQGFFMTRAPIKAITYTIRCEPAAFGVARLALPIAAKLQGKRQTFEIGASVHYKNGKGKLLRFWDGIFLRGDAKFDNSLSTTIMIAAAFTGHLYMHNPPSTTLTLPTGVAETLPGEWHYDVETLWRLGDPPLNEPNKIDPAR